MIQAFIHWPSRPLAVVSVGVVFDAKDMSHIGVFPFYSLRRTCNESDNHHFGARGPLGPNSRIAVNYRAQYITEESSPLTNQYRRKRTHSSEMSSRATLSTRFRWRTPNLSVDVYPFSADILVSSCSF